MLWSGVVIAIRARVTVSLMCLTGLYVLTLALATLLHVIIEVPCLVSRSN